MLRSVLPRHAMCAEGRSQAECTVTLQRVLRKIPASVLSHCAMCAEEDTSLCIVTLCNVCCGRYQTLCCHAVQCVLKEDTRLCAATLCNVCWRKITDSVLPRCAMCNEGRCQALCCHAVQCVLKALYFHTVQCVMKKDADSVFYTLCSVCWRKMCDSVLPHFAVCADERCRPQCCHAVQFVLTKDVGLSVATLCSLCWRKMSASVLPHCAVCADERCRPQCCHTVQCVLTKDVGLSVATLCNLCWRKMSASVLPRCAVCADERCRPQCCHAVQFVLTKDVGLSVATLCKLWRNITVLRCTATMCNLYWNKRERLCLTIAVQCI